MFHWSWNTRSLYSGLHGSTKNNLKQKYCIISYGYPFLIYIILTYYYVLRNICNTIQYKKKLSSSLYWCFLLDNFQNTIKQPISGRQDTKSNGKDLIHYTIPPKKRNLLHCTLVQNEIVLFRKPKIWILLTLDYQSTSP